MQVDAFGRRTHVIDATGRVSTYEYDSWGRVWREHYPDGGMLEREFSLINQVVRVVKANGVESTMQYDDEGRPERVSYPVVPAGILGDSADVLYNYDGYGRITSVSDGDSTISYEYDSLGNVIKETNGVGFHAPVRDTTYGYDSLSRLSSANYPTLPGHPAVSVFWEYGPNNHLTEVHGTLGAMALDFASYTYTGQSELREVNYGNGVKAEYQVSSWGAPLRLDVSHSSVTSVKLIDQVQYSSSQLREWRKLEWAVSSQLSRGQFGDLSPRSLRLIGF